MNKTVMNEEAARELALYIENNYELYAQYIVPYVQSLHKKRIKGTYDPDKAIPGWQVIATRGAQMYENEFLNVRYYRVFNKATRKETAKYLQEFFLDDIYNGI